MTCPGGYRGKGIGRLLPGLYPAGGSAGLGWVLFRAKGLRNGLTYWNAMVGLGWNAFVDDTFLFYLREYAVILAAGLLCSTPLLRVCGEKLQAAGGKWGSLWDVGGEAVQLVLFIVEISFLIMNAHNPFIYFNF